MASDKTGPEPGRVERVEIDGALVDPQEFHDQLHGRGKYTLTDEDRRTLNQGS